MTTAELHNFDDERLIREGEAAVTHYTKAKRDILPMALGLLAAKRKYPATQDFSDWLRGSPYNDLGSDDRAALIKLGEHERTTAAFLQTTNLASPESIWVVVRDLVPTSVATEVGPTPEVVSNPPPKGPEEPAKTPPAKTEEPKSRPEVAAAALPRTKVREKGKQGGSPSPLAGLPDADLVAAHHLDSGTRALLGGLAKKRGGRAIWALVVESITSGFFGEPNRASVTAPNMRLLLPWLPRGVLNLDITKERVQALTRDVVFPLLQREPALRKERVYTLDDKVEQGRRNLEEDARRQANLDGHHKRVKEVPMPFGEQPVIAYDAPLWPLTGDLTPPYTYDELRRACWYADFLMGLLARESPKSMAIAARHLTKYINDLSPGFVYAVRAIFNAYEERPDGEKKFPTQPPNMFT